MKQIILLIFISLLFCTSCKDNSNKNDKKESLRNLSKENLKPLIATCQLWGFLKYHHPEVAAGNYDWDKELLKRIPEIIGNKNEERWKKVLNDWIADLPPVKEAKDKKLPNKRIASKPNYGELFNREYFDDETINRTKYILNNAVISGNFYVHANNSGNHTNFANELEYNDILFPELPYRLLALFRYWNIVNYFFPYRDLCDQDWSDVLIEMLPEFYYCKNEEEYIFACIKLFAKIDDSHGFFYVPSNVYSLKVGLLRVPFETKFVEGKLVLTSFTGDDLIVKEHLKIGDVITHVDGQPIDSLVKQLIPYTPASNNAVKFRNIANGILNGNATSALITIQRDYQTFDLVVNRYDSRKLKIPNYNNPEPNSEGYRVLNNNIGYVLPSSCKAADRDLGIKKVLNGTKGLIIDMRCNPSDYISFSFLKYLPHNTRKFSTISLSDVAFHGYFFISNDKEDVFVQKVTDKLYQKKIVVIVNEWTQSQAEDIVLGFQLAPNTTVIGSTTAGANGRVVKFPLPGGILTYMTGLGVYYPDGSNLQRNGIHIDQVVVPTIQGVRNGIDEVLNRAIEIIEVDNLSMEDKPNA